MALRHRDDIQGLRGVAVLLVVLDHASVPGFAGGYVGVDVFFVLSGFLITRLLLSDVEASGRVSLVRFYVRRAKRILPAATLTLLVTIGAAYLLLNYIRAKQVASDAIWAALFAANVHFAHVGTDYFAQWQPQSPVQHYWTLSVEEQFYIVWPAALSLLLLGAVGGWRRRGHRASPDTIAHSAVVRVICVATVAMAASLAWSIYYTPRSSTDAYFSTFTRAWELGLGAILACTTLGSWGNRFRTVRYVDIVAPLAGWVGLGAVIWAATTYSSTTLFPGSAALVPVIGAAALIASGMQRARPRFSAAAALSSRPLRYIGDRSYALYLWHWPVLLIYAAYTGDEVSVAVKLVLACLAFALSVVSYKFVENPLRRARWSARAGLALWPVSAATVLVGAWLTIAALDARTSNATAAAPPPLRDVATERATNLRPLPAVVAAVKAARRKAKIPSPLTPPIDELLNSGYSFPAGCAPHTKETMSDVCKLGASGQQKTLVVMGDSFAQQWMPAILTMADRDGWVVVPLVNGSGCAASTWLGYPPRPWCRTWYTWALGQAKALQPDVTLIAGEWGPDTPPEAAPGAKALIAAAKRFSRSVVVVSVPPFQPKQPVDCLLRHGATMKSCMAIVPGGQSSRNDVIVTAFARKQRVGLIRPLGWFCARPTPKSTSYWCPLVVNRTITRFDTGHVTSAYVQELAGPFRADFRRALFG